MFGELTVEPYPPVEKVAVRIKLPRGFVFTDALMTSVEDGTLARELRHAPITYSPTTQGPAEPYPFEVEPTPAATPEPAMAMDTHPGREVLVARRLAPGRSLRCWYVNWRGEREDRFISPQYLWFGTSGYHPSLQWFMHVKDLDKCVERDFTLAGMENVRYV